MKNYFALVFFFSLILGCGDSDETTIDENPTQQQDSEDNNSSPPNNPDSGTTDSEFLTLIKASTIGTEGNDSSSRMAVNSQGNLIQIGTKDDESYLFTMDVNFNILWEKTFEDFSFFDLIIDNEDNLITVGVTKVPTTEEEDAHLTKFDASGNIVWQTIVGGSNSDSFWGVTQTLDGGYLATGTTFSDDGIIENNNGGQDLLAVMFDENGEQVWAKNYGEDLNQYSNDVIVQLDGNFMILGYDGRRGDIWVLQIDNDGAILNSKTIGSSSLDNGFSIVPLKNGNYAIAGTNEWGDIDATEHNGGGDAWFVIIDSSLNIVNQASFGEWQLDLIRDIFELPNGDFILTGISWSSNGILQNNQGLSDYWIIRVSHDLKIIDNLLLGGNSTDFISDAVLTDNNTLWVTGTSRSSRGDIEQNKGGPDIWTAQIFIPDN